MRKRIWFGYAMVMALGMCMGAMAEEEAQAPVAEVNVDVLSAYVWRALTLNDGMVVQPSLDAAHPSGLGFNVWGNFDIGDYDGKYEKREFSEVDLTVSYTPPLEGPIEITIGYTEYLYPKEGNYNPEVPEGHPEVEGAKDTDTREIWGKLSLSPLDALSLDLGIYRDVDESEGLYGDAALTYSYALMDALSAEASARLGVADKKFAEANAGGTEGGFFDWGASLKLTYDVADGFSVGATVAYVDNIDEDALPEDAVDVNWYGGLSATLSF